MPRRFVISVCVRLLLLVLALSATASTSKSSSFDTLINYPLTSNTMNTKSINSDSIDIMDSLSSFNCIKATESIYCIDPASYGENVIWTSNAFGGEKTRAVLLTKYRLFKMKVRCFKNKEFFKLNCFGQRSILYFLRMAVS